MALAAKADQIDSCSGDGRRVGNDGAARTGSGQLFYQFGLDEMIPTDRQVNVLTTSVLMDLHH